MAEDPELAAGIYSMLRMTREAEPTLGLIGIGTLMSFVSGRLKTFTPAQTQYLFANPNLLQWYRHLKQQAAIAELPLAAAASSNDLNKRYFAGGEINISLQSDDLALVFVRLDNREGWNHTALILEDDKLGFCRLDFRQAPDDDGEMQEFLDLTDSASRMIFDILSNPLSVGTFLRNPD